MKTIGIYLSLIFVLPLVWSSCSSGNTNSEGFQLVANLTNSSGQQANLDQITINQPNHLITNTTIENDRLSIDYPEGLEPGTYLLRVGAQRIILILEDGHENIVLNGDLTQMNEYQLNIEGSPATQQHYSAMRTLVGGGKRPTVSEIDKEVQAIDNPLAANMVAIQLLQRKHSAESLAVVSKTLKRLPETDPNWAGLNQFENQLTQTLSQQQSQTAIAPGRPAPDISLSSPDGTTYTLSDLRGQVVLLDFWASWCGPCRRENPNVVDVYNRYKDQGFTVYSVSLDGPDLRRNPGLANDPAAYARQQENSKQRWIAAIEQDKLAWPYHVSELKKWESTPGRLYGVRGIPRTFLIDRDGNIAAVGLRGAAQIEAALKEII